MSLVESTFPLIPAHRSATGAVHKSRGDASPQQSVRGHPFHSEVIEQGCY
ncbi:hypothetical protein T05_14684 [Trichinella murrelli]|uniref:Uncharacterized protein n=1 Tax=Trichinella murrelli TaxID=144512 RepID=A0A0V0SPP5_9BILA|nr:hypothetical protein T05_14684 [Trichinella murrelli]